jgi:glyoxalase family protein
MKDRLNITGIHHITAISSSAAENLDFYTRVLGLRLVKQTVNFDDPYTYHLYYGDTQGSPGTILTFFPWENLPQGRPGAGMITAVAFAVPRDAMDFWMTRLDAAGLQVQTTQRFGEPVLQFSDRHGLPLELIGTDERPAVAAWKNGPVGGPNAIIGFHSATMTLRALTEDQALLVDLMGLQPIAETKERVRFEMNDPGAPGHLLDIRIDPHADRSAMGVGSVHHIAFRTTDDQTQLAWQARLRKAGIDVTHVRDRNYFRSIYFHAPGGVLFEIATDPPGFGVDESVAQLGSALKLPPQYEAMRPDIVRRLPPLTLDTIQNVMA